MRRIIGHWTAGGYKADAHSLGAYHFLVEGDGTVVGGKFPPEANQVLHPGQYAAHCLNCNTGSIGVAMAAMRDATESPFSTGPCPIRPEQLASFIALLALLSNKYFIPISRYTILTHAEVQPTLGIRQRGKWDIRWLPGMKTTAPAVEVGDTIRERVSAKLHAGNPQKG